MPFNCKKVAENLRMVNGITASPDGKRYYIIETTQRTVDIFARNIENNELSLIRKINTLSGCDNIEYSKTEKQSVYIACHPKALTFQFHAQMPQSVLAPTRIVRLNDTDSSDDKVEIVLESLGEMIAGSSNAYKINDFLLIGSVHDDAYLLCPNFNQ